MFLFAFVAAFLLNYSVAHAQAPVAPTTDDVTAASVDHNTQIGVAWYEVDGVEGYGEGDLPAAGIFITVTNVTGDGNVVYYSDPNGWFGIDNTGKVVDTVRNCFDGFQPWVIFSCPKVGTPGLNLRLAFPAATLSRLYLPLLMRSDSPPIQQAEQPAATGPAPFNLDARDFGVLPTDPMVRGLDVIQDEDIAPDRTLGLVDGYESHYWDSKNIYDRSPYYAIHAQALLYADGGLADEAYWRSANDMGAQGYVKIGAPLKGDASMFFTHDFTWKDPKGNTQKLVSVLAVVRKGNARLWVYFKMSKSQQSTYYTERLVDLLLAKIE